MTPASAPGFPKFTQITNTSAFNGALLGISRDGSKVVFLTGCPGCEGGSQLWSVNTDGGGLMRITPASVDVIWGHFGGTKVVFSGQPPPGSSCDAFACPKDVFVVNADGTGLIQVTTDGGTFGAGSFSFPHISGDGTKVVYGKPSLTGPTRWFVTSSSGGPEQELSVPNPNQTDYRTLNADGSLLGVSWAQVGSFRYGVQRVNDANPLELLNSGLESKDLDLAGDGTLLAFSSPVATFTTDGTNAMQTLNPAEDGFHVSISHDGSRVCYNRAFTPPAQNIFCVDSPSGTPVNVTNSSAGGSETNTPFLSANGSVIAFISSADITGQNADGSREIFMALLSPSLAIDGGPASTRTHEDTFTFTGFGFTPNKPVTRILRQPDGTEITLTPSLSADGNGKVSWTFAAPVGTPADTYEIWIIDDTTGQISNIVYETIVPVLQ